MAHPLRSSLGFACVIHLRVPHPSPVFLAKGGWQIDRTMGLAFHAVRRVPETMRVPHSSRTLRLVGFIAGNVINDGNGNQPTYDAESTIASTMPNNSGVTYDAVYPERSRRNADGVRVEKSSGTRYLPNVCTGPAPLAKRWPKPDLSGNINEKYI